jgi:hypothetical protein
VRNWVSGCRRRILQLRMRHIAVQRLCTANGLDTRPLKQRLHPIRTGFSISSRYINCLYVSFMDFVTSFSTGICVRLIKSFQMALVGSCLPMFWGSPWVNQTLWLNGNFSLHSRVTMFKSQPVDSHSWGSMILRSAYRQIPYIRP